MCKFLEKIQDIFLDKISGGDGCAAVSTSDEDPAKKAHVNSIRNTIQIRYKLALVIGFFEDNLPFFDRVINLHQLFQTSLVEEDIAEARDLLENIHNSNRTSNETKPLLGRLDQQDRIITDDQEIVSPRRTESYQGKMPYQQA